MFALPIILPDLVLGHHELKNPEELFFNFLYTFLLIAFVEEIISRGFIQSRIRGIVKNKWVSILLGGLMFSVAHIPYDFLNQELNFISYLQKDYIMLIIYVIMHFYFVYIYSKTENILAPTITHTLINLVPGMIFVK